ncbi:MAG TPA: major capsid protein, partial [Longimicrobiaceae bacterium]|nr:major capsid protein [Longimicrobiaceae bacterium]
MGDLTYSTGALVGVVTNVSKPVLHFRDRYFDNFQYSENELVMVDVVNGMPRIAPYVSHKMPGVVMDFESFSTKYLKPGYLKPKHELDPDKWLKRLPGEVILGNLSPQQRRDLTVRLIFQNHEEMVSVAEEAQCAELLRTGKVVLNIEGYGLVTVDFGRNAALSIVKAGAALWSAGTATPLADIKAAARLARDNNSGYALTEVTMAEDAWDNLEARLTDREIQVLLNSLRGSESRMEMGPRAAKKLQYKGKLGDYQFWTYKDQYKAPDGTVKEMMPSGSVVITGEGLEGTRAYGAIKDPRAGFRAMRIFPKVWIDEDPAGEW